MRAPEGPSAVKADAACDVLIAGGGMVGASLAVALGQLPLRVTLVESIPLGAVGQQSFDARTTALSRSSRQILGALGIWAAVDAQATAIRRIHVSERGRLGTAVIDADEEGVPALGYVLPNRLLGAALWGALARRPNVTVQAPASVATVEDAGDGWRVHVAGSSGGTTCHTRLLVVADGARSPLRDALGIAARTRPYGQVAIVGTVLVERPGTGTTAYERFTADGPLALLPVGDCQYVFVLTRRTSSAPAVLALPDAEFLQLLQREFGFRLGRFQRVGVRGQYPLELSQAGAVTANRAVIVGNAAHGLHPVAGQGYNLGLRDAAVLAEVLAGQSHDPGDPALLARYADWRRADQRNVVAFTDGLIRLFDLAGVGALRGLGLLAFDALPGAKRLLARETMGLGGRRTRLARGLPLRDGEAP